ncbi:MAG: hypothetical protein VW230_05870 [Candidatus Poseidoniales archaeon]
MSNGLDVDEMVVQYPSSSKKPFFQRVMETMKLIFHEITFGVGTWGAMRPMVSAAVACIPFLFLGQHFNKEHGKARDWTLLQIPLALTVVLWIGLWLFSIFDAWKTATGLVAQAN